MLGFGSTIQKMFGSGSSHPKLLGLRHHSPGSNIGKFAHFPNHVFLQLQTILSSTFKKSLFDFIFLKNSQQDSGVRIWKVLNPDPIRKFFLNSTSRKWFSGLVRDFDRWRTCNCQHLGCQHVVTTCTPSDGISAATLQKPYKP